MTKRYQIKRSSLALAIGLVFASGAVLAQSAVGSIFGSAKSGSAVTIENTATGLSRDIVAHEVSHALLDGLRPNFMRRVRRADGRRSAP